MMTKAPYRVGAVALAASVLALGACSDGNGGDVVDPGTGTGDLSVTVVTQGAGIDQNGYVLTIDGGGVKDGDVTPTPIGGPMAPGTIDLNDLPAGVHSVAIEDVDAGCSVDASPRTVTVVTGQTARVSFTVTCQ